MAGSENIMQIECPAIRQELVNDGNEARGCCTRAAADVLTRLVRLGASAFSLAAADDDVDELLCFHLHLQCFTCMNIIAKISRNL